MGHNSHTAPHIVKPAHTARMYLGRYLGPIKASYAVPERRNGQSMMSESRDPLPSQVGGVMDRVVLYKNLTWKRAQFRMKGALNQMRHIRCPHGLDGIICMNM